MRQPCQGETVYLKRHFNKISAASGNKVCLFFVCLASFYFLFAEKDLVDTGKIPKKIWWKFREERIKRNLSCFI